MKHMVWLVAGVIFLSHTVFGATQLIGNGGFETKPHEPWEFAGTGDGLEVVSDGAHTGKKCLIMANDRGPLNQRVFQTITFPTNAIAVQLSYYWAESSTDDDEAFRFRALIVNNNPDQDILSNLNVQFNGNSEYRQKTFDLEPFAGQTVQVLFQVQGESSFSMDPTTPTFSRFRVDDVSAIAFFPEDIAPNDAFENRAVLTTSGTVTAANIEATKEPGEPEHAGNAGGHSLWWTWTAPADGEVTINTDGSSFNTLLGVYTGSSVDDLTEIASDDNEDGKNLTTSQVKFTAMAGTEYQIAVDGKDDATGLVQLNLSFPSDTNPFTSLAGAYQGLFYDTNSPAHESSGLFNLTVGKAGSYSAKVIIAGLRYSWSGQFSDNGFASNNIARKDLPPVSVQLHLDLAGGGITGELSDGTWLAELNALPVDKAPDQTGHFTLLIPGASDSAEQPGGDSYATIVVSPTGTITLKGTLADGTKVSQKAALTTGGLWPFYVPLYSGKGSIFGWLTFSNGANSDITGTVDWFKLSGAKGNFYPAGFTNVTDAVGSSYVFTPGDSVLNFSDGQVWFANGNLTSSFTNQVTLDAASKVTNLSANALSLKITTSTGLFKGSAVDPATGKAMPFNGVVLQKQNFGGGFFLGDTQTGRVFFGP